MAAPYISLSGCHNLLNSDKKRHMRKSIFVTLSFLCIHLSVYSQSITLRTYTGHVAFDVTNLRDYENGMVRTDWTTVQVEFNDGSPGDTWSLSVIVDDGASDFVSYGAATLPLDILELTFSDASPDNRFVTADANFESQVITVLSGAETVIATNIPQGSFTDNTIYVSYSLGTNPTPSLINQEATNYYLHLRFRAYVN